MRGFTDAGRPSAEVLAELKSLLAGDFDWRAGRLPLYMFSDSPKRKAVPVRLREVAQLVVARVELPAAISCSSGFQR